MTDNPKTNLVNYFRTKGIDLKYINSSIDLFRYMHFFHSNDTSYVVIEDVDFDTKYLQLYYKSLPLKKRALILWEPPTVDLFYYTKEITSKFSKIFTWNNHLVDNEKFFKVYHRVIYPMKKNLIPFNEKKFSCMVFTNKRSNYPLELYSLRRRVIKCFAKKANLFDLYGRSWPKRTPNYRGEVDDKGIIKNYKFCFAMENTRDLSGYLTEKICDVFQEGTLPIYWGDTNIENEIPSDCYIDLRKFANFDQLIKHLESITQ